MKHSLTLGAATLLSAFTLVACQDDLSSEQPSRRVKKTQETTAPAPASINAAGKPLFALSTFAYAFTKEASDKTFEITRNNGQMYVVQIDNGVPWAEALSGAPLPVRERRKWETFKRERPEGQPFYLSLAPLDFDRMNLAGPPEGSVMPASIRGSAFDSDIIKTAYLKYAQRAVDYFDPDFLNLGIEAGELAARRPSAWPAFTRLIEYVMVNLKREHPDLKIGISFGLQSLMDPATAQRSKSFIEKCDYLGLSFYPYMSEFHEKFGVSPLPDPPDEWRKPLEWVRNYTNKPIAICETGYNSTDATASGFGVNLTASSELQRQYVEDLGRIAMRDHHLFDIYYFPVDIDGVLAGVPDQGASGAILWRNNGLLDADLKPKPAWQAWQKILAGDIDPLPPLGSGGASSAPPAAAPAPTPAAPEVVAVIGFSNDGELFQSGPESGVSMKKNAGPGGANAMKWEYSLARSQWLWAVRTIDLGAAAGATNFEFDAKSKRNSSYIIQVKESSGESFFYPIQTGRDWARLSLKLSDFQLDPSTKRNGVLDLDNVNQIVIALSGEQKRGSGTLLLANMVFTR